MTKLAYSRVRPLAIFLIAISLGLSVRAQEADAGKTLATRVSAACGAEAWGKVANLRFTWKHLLKGADRSYDWNVEAKTVKVTVAKKTLEVPAGMWPLGSTPTADALRAHQAWVNDGFWALCALHLSWDQVEGFDDLGKVDVPQLPKLGKLQALRLRYGANGGYTPGDHYVLYLGADDRPVAWAFHKGGSKSPKLVTTWESYKTVGGISFPTRFSLPGGMSVIGIEGIGVTQRDAAPTSRPTSRPN
jgi:hypothetical protein